MKISFDNREINHEHGRSLLDSLLEAEVKIPNSCRMGSCQTCLVRVLEGSIPTAAQIGLKPSQQALGLLKSCVCHPTEDMIITLGEAQNLSSAIVVEKLMLNEQILRLKLQVNKPFQYEAGQFINLIRSKDNLSRSYSLASIPSESTIELHIRCYEQGQMSTWLKNTVNEGDSVEINGAYGECFYTAEEQQQPLLLAGIGTGMAPLYGILRDALKKGHKGPIHVVQGAMNEDGLYYVEEFQKIAAEFGNCSYIPAIVNGSGAYRQGKIDEVIKDLFPSLKGYKVFLCGSPGTVSRLRRYSFLAGASMSAIYSDPFTIAGK